MPGKHPTIATERKPYRYVRYSSPQQMPGDSLRRQIERTALCTAKVVDVGHKSRHNLLVSFHLAPVAIRLIRRIDPHIVPRHALPRAHVTHAMARGWPARSAGRRSLGWRAPAAACPRRTRRLRRPALAGPQFRFAVATTRRGTRRRAGRLAAQRRRQDRDVHSSPIRWNGRDSADTRPEASVATPYSWKQRTV